MGLEVHLPYSDSESKDLYLSDSDNPFFTNYIDVSEVIQILHKVLTKMLEINSDDVGSYSYIMKIYMFIILPSPIKRDMVPFKTCNEKYYYYQLTNKANFASILYLYEFSYRHEVSDF